MASKTPDAQVQTIEITNFGGRLTRILNGELNSGFAKFVPSWGYDPFSKPMNLTWLEAPTLIGGGITDLILTAKTRSEQTNPSIGYVYAVGSSGNLYKLRPSSPGTPNLDSSSIIGNVTTAGDLTFGASMDFFQGNSSVTGQASQIFVGSSTNVSSINFDGSGAASVVGGGFYYQNTYRPLKQNFGKLFFGNGNTIGAVDSTGTITSSVIGTNNTLLFSEMVPPLPVNTVIQDLDVSPDGNYLQMTTSLNPSEKIVTVGDDSQNSSITDANIYGFNNIDRIVTTTNSIPGNAVSAMQTYLQNNMFFSQDAFGAALNDGTNKILNLPKNKAPLPNATGVNGNFLFWMAPEITPNGKGIVGSMYYFGSLDQENPPGLFRVLRYSTDLTNGFIYQTPVNILVSGNYNSVNSTNSSVMSVGYGKHYFSVLEVNSSTSANEFLSFLITPTGTGTAQKGTYETQTQLFSKKITVKQIRVYTEPTVSGNGFEISCIGSDGAVISGGDFTYSFSAGTDPTLLQGSLERIDFNPTMKNTFALGLQISNTGNVNMCIKKVEVDWAYAGK